MKNIPKNWDAGARLLALARPIVETIALSAGLFIDEDNCVSGRSGPVPASRISFLTIELFAHLWFFGSYTERMPDYWGESDLDEGITIG